MIYRRWREGLLPGYIPTYADLHWYASDTGTHAERHLAALLQSLGVVRLTRKF